MILNGLRYSRLAATRQAAKYSHTAVGPVSQVVRNAARSSAGHAVPAGGVVTIQHAAIAHRTTGCKSLIIPSYIAVRHACLLIAGLCWS